MVYGLNSASAKFFCIWCYCTKVKIADFSSKLTLMKCNLKLIRGKFTAIANLAAVECQPPVGTYSGNSEPQFTAMINLPQIDD